MFVLVSVLKIKFRYRRESAFKTGREETFVEDNVLYHIAIELGQQRIYVSRMEDRHTVEQNYVFVITSAVHHKVISRRSAGHSGQNPYLRKQVVAAERQHSRWSYLSQFRIVSDGPDCNLVNLKQGRFEIHVKFFPAIEMQRCREFLISHVGYLDGVVAFREVQAVVAVFVAGGVESLAVRTGCHYDCPVKLLGC